MGLFDLFKNRNTAAGTGSESGSYFQTAINDEELRILINRAITIFQNNPHYNSNQLIDAIKAHRNEEELAVALYRFIPNAFCRIIYHEPNYADQYQLQKNGKTISSHAFSTDRIFNIVMEQCKKSFSVDNDQEKMVNILVHSAEFIAISKALEAGSKLEDLDFSETIYPV